MEACCQRLLLPLLPLLLLLLCTSTPYVTGTGVAPASDAPLFAGIDWSSLTADGIRNLSLAQVGAANASDLARVPGAACAGFSAPQIAMLGPACAGLTGPCTSNITEQAAAGFGPQCAYSWSTHVTASLSMAQVAALNSSAVFPALRSEVLRTMSARACAGMSAAAIAVLGSQSGKWALTAGACTGLRKQCAVSAPDDAFSALSSQCAIDLPSDSWGALRPRQLALVSPASLSVLDALQLAALRPPACGALSADQVNALPDMGPSVPWWLGPHTCALLQADCVAALSTKTLSQIGANCVGDFNSDVFALLSGEQFAALSLDAIANLMPAPVAQLGAKQCSGMRPEQVGVLGTLVAPHDACVGLRSACVSALNATSLAAFTPACFTLIDPKALSQLSPASVGAISGANVRILTSAQLSSIPSASCAGWTGSQMSLLGSTPPYDTCAGMGAGCVAALQPSSLYSLSSTCAAVVAPSVFSSISLARIALLPDSVLSALTTPTLVAWTRSFNVRFVSDAWPAPLRAELLHDDAILGFKLATYIGEVKSNMTLPSVPDVSSLTSLQLAYCKPQCMDVLLSPSSDSGISSGPYLLQLPSLTYRGLRADQLALVPASVVAALSNRALKELQSDTVAALTPDHINALSPSQFASLNIGGLNINSGAVASVSLAQVIAVTAPQWMAQWSCKQYNHMTADQRGVMAPTALASFQTDCLGPPAPPAPVPLPCPVVGYSEPVYVASVAGAAGGTAVLALLFYCIFLRPALASPARKKKAAEESASKAEEYQYGSYGGIAASSNGSLGARRGYADMSPQLRQPLHAGSLGGGHLGAGVGVTALVHAGSSPTSFRHVGMSPQFALAADLQDDDQEEEQLGSRF